MFHNANSRYTIVCLQLYGEGLNNDLILVSWSGPKYSYLVYLWLSKKISVGCDPKS